MAEYGAINFHLYATATCRQRRTKAGALLREGESLPGIGFKPIAVGRITFSKGWAPWLEMSANAADKH